MLTSRLSEMLVAQIGNEIAAHQNYMAIAVYFRRLSLDRWAELFHKQSVEEAQHATKIIDFLLDCEVEFDLPAIPQASTRFGSPIDACRAALKSEQNVSKRFQEMAVAAMEEKDFRGFQFLQWFIEEQVEEESKIQKLIDFLESGINPFQAQSQLDEYDTE